MTFEHLSDDQIADEITTWAARVAAGEARLLTLIAEFDRREAWGGPGLLSCAHWLSWKLGLGLTAAHERVRVARALTGLPRIAEAFGQGRMSWSQVRAVTRVASELDEQDWVDLARHSTGAQLEKLVRGVRRVRRTEEDAADPELAQWRMRTRVSYDQDGSLVITSRVPAEHGAVVLAALERMREEIDLERKQAHAAAADGEGESSAEDSAGPSAPVQESSAEDSPPAPEAPAEHSPAAPEQDPWSWMSPERAAAARAARAEREAQAELDAREAEVAATATARGAAGWEPTRAPRARRWATPSCGWRSRPSRPPAPLTPRRPGAAGLGSPPRSTRCRGGDGWPTASCCPRPRSSR